MGCKHSRVRRTRVHPDGGNACQVASLVLENSEIGGNSLVLEWLRNVVHASGDIVVEDSDGDRDEGFTLVEEFIVGERCKRDEKPKAPYDANLLTPCPFKIEVKEENEDDFYCASMALEEASAGKSTFFFNHLPSEVIAQGALPYEKAPKEELNKATKERGDPRKRDLKKRKAKQQRREADQIRRKRKRGTTGALADDDTLADLKSSLQMPEIHYSMFAFY